MRRVLVHHVATIVLRFCIFRCKVILWNAVLCYAADIERDEVSYTYSHSLSLSLSLFFLALSHSLA